MHAGEERGGIFLLPVLVTLISLGGRYLLWTSGRFASSTAHNIVAGFAVRLGLLVVRPARLGFRGLLGGSKSFVASANMRSRGRLRFRVRVIIPADLFFVLGIGAYIVKAWLAIKQFADVIESTYPSGAPCASSPRSPRRDARSSSESKIVRIPPAPARASPWPIEARGISPSRRRSHPSYFRH